MSEALPKTSSPMLRVRSIRPNKELAYKGMDLPNQFHEKDFNNKPKDEIATAASMLRSPLRSNTPMDGRRASTVTLQREVLFINYVQPPHDEGQLGKFEAAARRNLAVRTAITVREHFAFGRPSKLVIELNESDKLDLDEEQQNKKVEELTKKNLKMLKRITDLDEKIELVKHAKGPFYWQNLIFGRGAMIKVYSDDQFTKIRKLIPINTRRMGLVILDDSNQMEFEGVYIDGTPLDRQSMIYGTYQERQISPYTEHYGYSALEPVMHIAEEHNIAMEEDMKEILKSAWLKSILFLINTAGMSAADAATQIRTVIDSIDPGKYIGANADIKEAIPLDLEPDFAGIVAAVDSLETKIFKALFVPQFLVQSEDMANRATANKSASLFIDGPVATDQQWMSDTLWIQHYEPLLRQELSMEIDPNNPDEKDEEPLPFKIKRQWEKPTVEEFLDLAESLERLLNAKIWDTEQANKILQTPEVAKRVAKMIEDEQRKMDEQMEQNKKDKEAEMNLKNKKSNAADTIASAAKSLVKG